MVASTALRGDASRAVKRLKGMSRGAPLVCDRMVPRRPVDGRRVGRERHAHHGGRIGRATAVAWAQAGARIVIADVDVAWGEATAHLITTQGDNARFVRADVSQAADVEALIGHAVEAYGRLDCAVNHAGIYSTSSIIDTTEAEWEQVIRTNLMGVWLCMKAEIPQMLTQGRSAMVNSASMVGLVAGSREAYTASKHSVVGLTTSAAVAHTHGGIRINAVCPGLIRSPMTEPLWAGDPPRATPAIARHPMGRAGFPEEVAAAVVWLCSDAASFVTGHMLSVDGGYVAQ
jgi:NAD(P)-dependent dehydrogenase (short-subunit alcohol dehydrogenase family)